MAKKPDLTPTEDSKTGTALAEQTGTMPPVTGTEADAPRKGPPGVTVIVTALQARRWRIGRAFGHEPTTIPAEELTEDEARALQADPLLTIQVVDAPY